MWESTKKVFPCLSFENSPPKRSGARCFVYIRGGFSTSEVSLGLPRAQRGAYRTIGQRHHLGGLVPGQVQPRPAELPAGRSTEHNPSKKDRSGYFLQVPGPEKELPVKKGEGSKSPTRTFWGKNRCLVGLWRVQVQVWELWMREKYAMFFSACVAVITKKENRHSHSRSVRILGHSGSEGRARPLLNTPKPHTLNPKPWALGLRVWGLGFWARLLDSGLGVLRT